MTPKYYQKTSTIKDANFTGTLDEPYTQEAGLIAQELQQIPEVAFAVSENSEADKPMMVDYNSINMFLLQAVKDLIARVETLEARTP
jgi:hypothetical protein